MAANERVLPRRAIWADGAMRVTRGGVSGGRREHDRRAGAEVPIRNAPEQAGQTAERSGAPYCWPAARHGEHPDDSASQASFSPAWPDGAGTRSCQTASSMLRSPSMSCRAPRRSGVRPCSLRPHQRRERDAQAVLPADGLLLWTAPDVRRTAVAEALDQGYVSAALRAAFAAKVCTIHTPPKRGVVVPFNWDSARYARRHQLRNLFSPPP